MRMKFNSASQIVVFTIFPLINIGCLLFFLVFGWALVRTHLCAEYRNDTITWGKCQFPLGYAVNTWSIFVLILLYSVGWKWKKNDVNTRQRHTDFCWAMVKSS